jgi:hypothetical protein
MFNHIRKYRFKLALKYGTSDYNLIGKKLKSNDNKLEIGNLPNDKRLQIWKYVFRTNLAKEDMEIKKKYLPQKPKVKRIVNEVDLSEEDNKSNKKEKPCSKETSKTDDGKTNLNDNNTNNSTTSNSNTNSVKNNKNSGIENKPKISIKENPKIKEELVYINEDYFSSGYEFNFSNKPYSEILSVVNKENALQTLYDTIYLDVLRTFYNLNDSEELRKKLFNILKIISYVTKVSYCQGMNYVGGFLLFLTNKKEEEAFNLFYLLVQGTEFRILFEDELFVLKKYFFIYERLTEILLPEISQAFKYNSIQVSFFSSSWFITIFTSIISDQNSIPRILYHIWDDFIYHGWRTVLKIGICLLKIHENKLLAMKYEDMLQFLLNEIYNCWLFKNEFLEDALCLFHSIKIKRGLIQNLEIEYELKKSADA